MCVEALPPNPSGLMDYSFNWSPEGVVNESLNNCQLLEGGEIICVSAMEWMERLYIHGIELGAFTAEFVRAYEPRFLAGAECDAISRTDASKVVAIFEMVRDGTLPSRVA